MSSTTSSSRQRSTPTGFVWIREAFLPKQNSNLQTYCGSQAPRFYETRVFFFAFATGRRFLERGAAIDRRGGGILGR